MEISYTSKLFSLKHCLRYNLSIQASLNGFSFCVYDSTRNTYLLLKYFPIAVNNNQEYYLKHLGEIIKKEEVLRHKFRKVNFVYFSSDSIIIPKELSKEDDLKDYLGFQQEVNEYDEIHYKTVEQLNSTVIYSIPSAITNIFLNLYDSIAYTNQVNLLLRIANDIIKNKSLSEFCLINKNESFFDIVVFKNGKLQLHNTFNYVTENDLVYYSLSTLKSLGLADSNCPVYYSGRFRAKGQDTLMLNKFIKVFVANEPVQIAKMNNIEMFKMYPIHFFAPLYFLNY